MTEWSTSLGSKQEVMGSNRYRRKCWAVMEYYLYIFTFISLSYVQYACVFVVSVCINLLNYGIEVNPVLV